MSLGILMMVHTDLDRAAQVARYWATSGNPVVFHVDKKVSAADERGLRKAISDLDNIRFAAREDCRWGTWSLVAATQNAAEKMLSEFPTVRHVALTSGSCIPLRPVEELVDYLDDHPRTDFIESVTVEDVPWTIGGLHHERFTLRFPFSWKTHRRSFDRYVRLQRRLGLRRRVPQGIDPHLGSQWWCLTPETLASILTHPRRATFDRYFKSVWIPDESYFQTLARVVAPRIESRTLTLAKFDLQGKPYVFYDDHLQLLRRSDCFLARKIWPRADRLYDAFLAPASRAPKKTEPNPQKIDRVFTSASERRTLGRPGLLMQSRFPRDSWQGSKTAAPYSVFQGFSEVFEDYETWLSRRIGARVHGHLFDWTRVQYAGGEKIINGGMSDSVDIRDRNPTAFLTSLIWNTRGERQCFQYAPYDRQAINDLVIWDANAQISVISGAWAIKLFRASMDFQAKRKEAAWMQRAEAHFLEKLRMRGLPARVRIWTLAEFIDDPMEHLQGILDEIEPTAPRRLVEAPRMVDLTGFSVFLQQLKNAGMKPYLTGDFPAETDPSALSYPGGSKPYLVNDR
ncbi:MAG: hypothetical protein ACJA0F_001446 [Dinoroseobacter sp.]|jgi:hypothetical protein